MGPSIYLKKRYGRIKSRERERERGGGGRKQKSAVAMIRKAPWRQEQSQAACLIKHLLPCLNLFEAQKYMKYYTG